MKLKYIFTALVAVLALFSSCNDDQTLDALGKIQVSQSFVSIPVEGGRASFEVNAASDWKVVCMTKDKNKVEKDSIPTWLKVTPTEGQAGKTTITVSAEATSGANSTMLQFVCDNEIQRVNIVQGILNPPFSTCAEVIAGADGDTYKVKGTVASISNTTYGNWYLDDGTGQLYIYGTLDANGGEKNFASLGIEEGDEVTVQGPKTTYGSTVELVNVSVLKITKSLVKLDSLSVEKLGKEGGEFIAHLTVKGDGLSISIPETAQSWLSIKSIVTEGTKTDVTFKATVNTLGARSADISFTSSKNGQSSTVSGTITQDGSIIECSIADFNAAAAGSTIYRITGVITKVDKAAYGNVYIKDATGETYVYGIGSKGDFEAKGLKVGDIVTLTGPKDIHENQGQMKNSTLEDSKSVTKISVADFLTKADDKNTWYMLEGTIDEYAGQKFDLATYGNFGLTDATGSAYVYGITGGWNGASKQAGTLGLEKGKKITIIGYHTSYKGAAQVGGAFLFEAKQ